ncbi:hypothetical protein COE61_32830 [Bacillus thuringiensis]|nr:hypothetical protein COE61_32830 [Bacillus thuringiensis]
MDYIDTCQYTEIHANEIEIPKHCVRFLFIYLILRKIGISCELVVFLNKYTLLLSNFIGPFL